MASGVSFLCRSANRDQVDNVRGRQGRIGGVRDIELVQIAAQAEAQVILLHFGGCGNIYCRCGFIRITKYDNAVLQLIASTPEENLTRGQMVLPTITGLATVPITLKLTSPSALASELVALRRVGDCTATASLMESPKPG